MPKNECVCVEAIFIAQAWRSVSVFVFFKNRFRSTLEDV